MGNAGSKGDDGENGRNGEDGKDGKDGKNGKDGDKGKDGEKGKDGSQGPSGGVRGDKGEDGKSGGVGPAGPQGPSGGVKGEDGKKGLDGYITGLDSFKTELYANAFNCVNGTCSPPADKMKRLKLANETADDRIQLYDGYTIGIRANTLLFKSGSNHQFLAGENQTMMLDGTGKLDVKGKITANERDILAEIDDIKQNYIKYGQKIKIDNIHMGQSLVESRGGAYVRPHPGADTGNWQIFKM